MLQYEWRSGRKIDSNNSVLDNDDLTVTYDYIPEPVQQDMQPAELNSL